MLLSFPSTSHAHAFLADLHAQGLIGEHADIRDPQDTEGAAQGALKGTGAGILAGAGIGLATAATVATAGLAAPVIFGLAALGSGVGAAVGASGGLMGEEDTPVSEALAAAQAQGRAVLDVRHVDEAAVHAALAAHGGAII